LPDDEGTANPSNFWKPWANAWQYLLDLSPENLRNIRYHTGLFSGGIPGHGLWGDGKSDDYTYEEAKQIGYTEAINGLPEKYWLGEPETARAYGPLGKQYLGRTVSPIIVRSQRCVFNLYSMGVMQQLEQSAERQTIMEVGAGYGGFAHALGKILKGKITYLIVDLPEMLFVSGVYLTLTNLGQSIYVYDKDSFTPEFVAHGMHNYDFVLVPNFALSKLHPIDEIALMVNMESFQEMTDPQVEEYLSFCASRITGFLYSYNTETFYLNQELASLSALFTKYFDLYPDPSFYDELVKDRSGWDPTRRHHFGVPMSSGRTNPKASLVGLPTSPRYAKRLARAVVPRWVRQLAIRTMLEG